MDVWANPVDSWLDETDDCPYCGAHLKLDYVSDGEPEPDELECPVCGKVAELLVEYEPCFGLFRKDRFDDAER